MVERCIKQEMKALLVAGVLLVLCAACGAYSFPGGTTAGTGNVHGTVRVFPCAPVEQQGETCNGLIGTGFVIQFTDSSETHAATVDSNGDYSIDLPAGTWKVSFKGIARITSGPNPVTVATGASIEADYQVDSGIRAPAAAPAAS